MKRIVLSLLITVMTLAAASLTVVAQRETDTGVAIDKDINLMHRDLRSEKKKIIAMTMTLTETEAQKFWPVYDQYATEMTKPTDEFYTLVRDYIANQKVMTDPQAITMIKRWAEIQGEQLKVRQRYIPLFEKVIPGKKVALFFQVDRRLYGLIDLQVASQLPIVYQ